MIRPVYKASGTTQNNGTTATTTGTGQTNAQVNAQVAGSVTNTAIKEGTGLAAGILTGGATYVIDAITSIFTGAFNMVTTIGTTRNNNAARTAQTYWYLADNRNDDRETNNGFYAIIGLALIALVVVLIVNHSKNK